MTRQGLLRTWLSSARSLGTSRPRSLPSGGLTLDARALIAYERGDERIREILTVAYARGLVPTIPAIVLAEVRRGDAKDARVACLLKASSIETVDEQRAAGQTDGTTPAVLVLGGWA